MIMMTYGARIEAEIAELCESPFSTTNHPLIDDLIAANYHYEAKLYQICNSSSDIKVI